MAIVYHDLYDWTGTLEADLRDDEKKFNIRITRESKDGDDFPWRYRFEGEQADLDHWDRFYGDGID